MKHIINYEEMVDNFEDGVKALIKDLGWTVDPGRLKCLIKHAEGVAKRKAAAEKLTLPINATQVERLASFFCRSNR